MRQHPHFQRLVRPLVEYRILLSLGLSAACGIVLNSMFPINTANPLLCLIALERPAVFHAVVWSYGLFLYSTPFLAWSMIFSLLYVHLYRSEQELATGSLPPYPDPHTRTELSLVLGEVHRQLVPKPSPAPQWFSIPERGLYTGIASFGSIGSGKTYGLILPAMRQLFAYCADDPARRLSGIVLEVKGDLCRQLQRILKWCGREEDYVEVSLDGDIRYNPLNNSLDAYAQAFNIASIITSIWGKGTLRDVLGFHADEVAGMMDSTIESVNSALKRARASLQRRHLPGADREPPPVAKSRSEDEVVAKFMSAWVSGDLDALVTLLTDDVFISMPPMPFEYEGRDLVARFCAGIFGAGRRFDLLRTRAKQNIRKRDSFDIGPVRAE